MQINDLPTVSAAPHIKGDEGVRSMMLDVIIALCFPLIMAVYFFGGRALTLTLVSVTSCIAFEWLYRYLTKKPAVTGDLSAAVTGMLLALSLPASSPMWLPVLGAAFGIVVVKQLYGGLGNNFMNPACAGRVFLMLSFPRLMSLWTKPLTGKLPMFGGLSPEELASAVVSATPLAKLKSGHMPFVAAGEVGSDVVYTMRDLLIGNVPGALGEVSAIVILAALVYLVVRRVITLHIPLSFILSAALFSLVLPHSGATGFEWMLSHVFSGGLLFCAVFMATDPVTSPVTAKGKIIFGICCGIITVFIRGFCAFEAGAPFAILIMNSFTWLIDRRTLPRRFGVKPERGIRKAGDAR